METLSSISDRIEDILRARPGGLAASAVVSELSRQGVAGDDAAAALAAGLGYRRWELDARFRVSVPMAQAAVAAAP